MSVICKSRYLSGKTYVIKVEARVNQNQEKPRTKPEKPDARRLQGARRAVKNDMTAKKRPMR
jgi:hypothetical protein